LPRIIFGFNPRICLFSPYGPIAAFFYDNLLTPNSIVSLDTDTARHIAQVLRMKPGEQLSLTDGKGGMATGTILAADKNKCSIRCWRLNRTHLSRHNCIS
jgi:16S rRNA (uracil1498-N3)-methyltransferase